MRNQLPWLKSVATLGLVFALLNQEPQTNVKAQQFHEVPVSSKPAVKTLKRSEILQILTERIDVSEVQAPRKLAQFLDWVQKKVETKRGGGVTDFCK